jgi:histidyl-tRNA synthetase|uniref:Histidine--tRNA ligase n=1 Tax=Desulfobacca acetoxidans TaxID=60893 RepID=A0A7V6A4Y2_9BACT
MIHAIRGMKDILPPETSRWQWVETEARKTFELYGYQEIRLPLLERTELFARSIGADTDIVAKEMYTFTDRKGDSLTLRPEATAQVVRACLENGLMNRAGVRKFYLIGPMFRYERPQKGRYRQFHQINCEALGSEAPELDAEVILMLLQFLGRVGLPNLRLLINSLGCPECTRDFKAQLQLFLASQEGWCDDCLRRRDTNPLRVLDCKSQHCQALLEGAPTMEDSLCEACSRHYQRVLDLLDGAGQAYEKNPRLVRGLDYYTRTAFEVVAEGLGAQNSVAGGGRYNGLAKELGGADLPGLGFAIGEDRLLEVLPPEAGPDAGALTFLAALGDAARERAFFLNQKIRAQGLPAAMDFEGRSLKSQMSLADRLGATLVVILGDQELAAGTVTLRRMATGEQETVPLTELVTKLKALTGPKEGT